VKIVVTGLPRSGTSLMMQTLAWSGIPLITDTINKWTSPDLNNPRGYFESSTMELRQGYATKVLFPWLLDLNIDSSTFFVVMKRDLTEVTLSWQKLCERRGTKVQSFALLLERFTRNFKRMEDWLFNKRYRFVDYSSLVTHPCFDQKLYRNRMEEIDSCQPDALIHNRMKLVAETRIALTGHAEL